MKEDNLLQIYEELKKVEHGELIIDGIKIKTIPLNLKKKIEQNKNIITLSMNNCDLENLDNLPILDNLIRLEIMGNKFNAEELKKIIIYKNLECVSLGENLIEKIEDILILEKLENLVQLDLSGTILSKKKNYRTNLFEFLKTLIILDNKDLNGKSFDYSESESLSKSDFEEGNIFKSDDGASEGNEDISEEKDFDFNDVDSLGNDIKKDNSKSDEGSKKDDNKFNNKCESSQSNSSQKNSSLKKLKNN